MPSEQEIESLMQAVDTLKAMANPKRLAILCRLGESEVCVNELSEEVQLSQSALSQHLAKLREQGLVSTRRDQQTIYYRLDSPEIETLIRTLREALLRLDQEKPPLSRPPRARAQKGFPLPSSIFHLPSSFFLLPSSFERLPSSASRASTKKTPPDWEESSKVLFGA